MHIVEPGSVILVTGASGGIGFEIAAEAAEQGATVAVHGSKPASVSAAIERLRVRAPEGRFIAAPADYKEPGAIRAMVEAVAAEAGGIDAVVDCAVTGPAGNVTGVFMKVDPAVFAPAAALSIAPFQELCHAAIPHLARQGGAIVAFVSDSGRFAAPRQSMIAARMAAIIGFVRSLALEVGRDQVRVNCISPSFVEETPIFDRFLKAAEGRAQAAREKAALGLPTPRDIAPLALFLCGPQSKKITGQIISVNGGVNA
jgi:NAD(P)-dependent dehydrogenase (short-subunit alcohol dehydrogenase family)